MGRKLNNLTRYFGTYGNGQVDRPVAVGSSATDRDWLIKGEYWQEEGGPLFIKAVLKDLKTGREFVGEPVTNSWISYQTDYNFF